MFFFTRQEKKNYKKVTKPHFIILTNVIVESSFDVPVSEPKTTSHT